MSGDVPLGRPGEEWASSPATSGFGLGYRSGGSKAGWPPEPEAGISDTLYRPYSFLKKGVNGKSPVVIDVWPGGFPWEKKSGHASSLKVIFPEPFFVKKVQRSDVKE